ncbi:hypothetical protein Sjap_011359 [Stephania japonica]|uniref:Ribosomal RNA-processing protein 14/surfeit locus protein 6 C-terminal domain-containing protein n=1 Tax=Stephania japonica TaxID=461633 RepID=A0AAP0JAZ1_9MAGN
MKMKKEKHQKSILANNSDLESIIEEHSQFFDKLIELVPARFYLPVDDKEKPYFQGLSKVAKASAKKESRENIKKARRARLDPDKSSSTLDLLKQSLETEKSIDVDNEGGGDDDDDDDNDQLGHSNPENRSVTHEELVERLHRRLEELRSKRNTGSSERSKRREGLAAKRKRGGEADEERPKAGENSVDRTDEDANEASEKLTFGHVKIGSEGEAKGRKKRKLSKSQMLEKAKRLEGDKKDPEKGEAVSKKHSWTAATSRAAGVKVHDDPRLLKQSLKKEKKRHEKSVEKWKERNETVEKGRAEKQQKRSRNIADKIHQKKMRRIAKREKKLMRPGFEGRREGFINES